MQKENRKSMINAGAVFVGCMFIGLGLGFLFNQITVGVLLGMGVGFLGKALLDRNSEEKNGN